MALDFSKLLSKPLDSVEKPKPLPVGTYLGIINKYEFGESKEKKTPYVRFHFQVTGAGEDVDADELAAAAPDLSKKQLRRDYYLTDDAMYRLKELFESTGVQTAGRSFAEAIPDLLNVPVHIAVSQRNGGEGGTEIFNDVGAVTGQS